MAEQPRHTKIPNAILDSMAELSEPELRVLLIITRKTIGWQKECDLISLTQLEKLTGLSRPAVNKALQTTMQRGWVECTGRGKQGTGCYRLSPELVNDVNQLTEITSKQRLPKPVNDVNRSSPELVNDVNTQKKDLKEKKERGSGRADRAPRAPSEKEEKTPAPIITALADVCKIDQRLGTKEQKLQLYSTAKDLYQAGGSAGKTPEEIAETIRYVGKHWISGHWKGKKGDTPWPKDIREHWRVAIEARGKNGHLNGTIPKPAYVPPADLKSPEEVAARMKELIAQQRGGK